eukprot:9491322-Pyramimonas_sp.AAC.1
MERRARQPMNLGWVTPAQWQLTAVFLCAPITPTQSRVARERGPDATPARADAMVRYPRGQIAERRLDELPSIMTPGRSSETCKIHR